MKNLKEKFIILALAVIALVIVVWIGSSFYSAWQGYQWQKQTDAFQESLKRPYKEDTYGGKTPEETWTMFLDALKKGDVELASKYFVVEKQSEEKKFLSSEKIIDGLKLFIEQLSSGLKKEESSSDGIKAYYYYELKDIKTGKNYNNSVVFTLNPYTKVWKISVL